MKQTFKIGRKTVGEGRPCFVIAEAGSNHDRKIEQAKQLIDIAVKAKADAVKFQLFKAEHLCTPQDPAYKIVQENEFPREWIKELNAYAGKKGIAFLATPFDKEAVDLLEDIACPVYKVASSEVTNLLLLRYIAAKKKPILLSTGMSNLADIYEALEVIRNAGNEQVALLQCSAVYPVPAEDVCLRNMDTLKNSFQVPVGYSDHTLGILMPPVAVARGASFIEKHFTLDRTLKGPDHSYAVEGNELQQMVNDIRTVEKCLGSPEKKMLPEERKFGRREGLYVAESIGKNGRIGESVVTVKRPALGIDARFLKTVLGQRARKALKKGDPILWEDLQVD